MECHLRSGSFIIATSSGWMLLPIGNRDGHEAPAFLEKCHGHGVPTTFALRDLVEHVRCRERETRLPDEERGPEELEPVFVRKHAQLDYEVFDRLIDGILHKPLTGMQRAGSPTCFASKLRTSARSD